jgi:hypothetical protein
MKLRDALRDAFTDYGEVIASIQDGVSSADDWEHVWPNVEALLAHVPDDLEAGAGRIIDVRNDGETTHDAR